MNIKIKREKRLAYSARKIQIFIDDSFIGEVKNGGELSTVISDSTHGISLKIGNKTMAFASVSPGSDDVLIVCWASSNGGIEFYSANQNVLKQSDSSKKSYWWIAILAIIIAVFLFLLFEVNFVLFIPIK